MKKLLLSVLLSAIFLNISLTQAALQWDGSTMDALKKIKLVNPPKQTSDFQPDAGDLVIGEVDPNEVVTITGNYFLDGDIFIVNNGILNIDSADFKINGNISIFGHGQLNVNGGTFTVMQNYIYEHNAWAIQAGKMRFKGVTFQASGQSWSNAFVDSAYYLLEDCKIQDGFITTVVANDARADIENTYLPGEFLCFYNADLRIKNSDLFLVWLILPDSSHVDYSLPGDSLIDNWVFSDILPGIENIPYTVAIDSSTNVMWGIMSMTGSEATFRDSEFRTIGLIFTSPDSIMVKNITNDSEHIDDKIEIPDRSLRLINSKVHTWSFYAQKESRLTVENCVFGELLAQDSSGVFVINSVCDGTGGYLGAFSQSELIVFGSLIRTQVIARDNSVLVGAEAAFWGSEIIADEYGIMLIANTATAVEPEAHSSAMIFEARVPQIDGLVDDEVPIVGTARLLKGPENPIQFLGYELAFTDQMDQPNWQSMGMLHSEQVVNDTLEIWNTAELDPGYYAIRIQLHHSFGEPIPIMGSAYLYPQTDIREENPSVINEDEFYLSQNYPNPFNSDSKIQFHLPMKSHVRISILNIRGREIARIMDSEMEKGLHQIEISGEKLPSGIFFCRMVAGSFVETRKIIVVK